MSLLWSGITGAHVFAFWALAFCQCRAFFFFCAALSRHCMFFPFSVSNWRRRFGYFHLWSSAFRVCFWKLSSKCCIIMLSTCQQIFSILPGSIVSRFPSNCCRIFGYFCFSFERLIGHAFSQWISAQGQWIWKPQPFVTSSTGNAELSYIYDLRSLLPHSWALDLTIHAIRSCECLVWRYSQNIQIIG